MKPVDKAVRQMTLYVAGWTLVFSLLMQAVFLVGGWWHYTVLFGNLLGGTAAVGNFFLMGLTVQNAVQKDEKDAKQLMKASQSGRLFLLLGVAVIGAAIPAAFNLWATLLSLFFPRLAVMLRPLFKSGGDTTNE